MKNELTLSQTMIKLKTNFTDKMNEDLNELAAAAGEELRDVETRTGEKVQSSQVFANHCGNFDNAQELFVYFTKDIENLREKHWHLMNNDESFVTDCYNKLRYAARTYVKDKSNFISRIHMLFQRVLGDHCSRRGDKRKVLKSRDQMLEGAEGRHGNIETYHEIDPNTNVQDEVLAEAREQELINKYGKDDRSTAIMEIIMGDKGYIKQADIARQLADKLSISFDSARSSVRTFLKNMKEDITTNERFSA
ncbi:hypothetical protein P4261_28280 [Bacillus thuringiensis]|nr:hypothetical protein [Bacillus thuringiensis]MED2829690.1 hypothetical protein [Bacillus thuringiensis]MED2856359.1 hypothetical protein [Bacillus thuringiensis]MED2863837.1 hypothetical protein [Bacillus thuringiensis]